MIFRKNWRDWVFWPIIIIIVSLSFVQTTRINDRLASQQSDQITSQDCTTTFLGQAFAALGERTRPNRVLNEADRAKTQKEAALFGFLTQQLAARKPGEQAPQAVIDEYNKRISQYFDGISGYLTALNTIDTTQKTNPIPTKKDYRTCLKGGE